MVKLIVGAVVAALPWVVGVSSGSFELSSVSSAYHSGARAEYVALLCTVSLLLWISPTTSRVEWVATRIASLSTALLALIPTSAAPCQSNLASKTHYGAALVLIFAMLTSYVLLLREELENKPSYWQFRVGAYTLLGLVVGAAAVARRILNSTFDCGGVVAMGVTFWTETIALAAFGVTWIVAGIAETRSLGRGRASLPD